MSHTNSTANYNLPQFIGSDTPAWLTDVNGAMSAIDTQMKTNADTASTASTSATTANTNIGTLSNLNTTAKTDLVSAVNEVNTSIGTVSGVASNASGTANNAKQLIDSLNEYLDINTFIQPVPTTSNGTIYSYNLGSASNSDGSLGKIYGQITVAPSNNTSTNVTFQTNLRPTENIEVNGIATIQDQSGSPANQNNLMLSVNISTSGLVTLTFGNYWYNKVAYINLYACLIFCKNFGDTIIEG